MGLNLYERAYLCGGPDRAARTALASLHAAALVRVDGSSLHRAARANRSPVRTIEVALLNSLPASGLPVRLVVRRLADSPEVAGWAAVLMEKKLLRRSPRGRVRPTRAGVELRERLAVEVSDDEIDRFAVLGTSPATLRLVLAALPPEAAFPIKLPKHKVKQGYNDRGDYDPPIGNATAYGT